MDLHSLRCLKKPKFCKFCNNIYFFGDLQRHEESCGKSQFVCDNCCKNVMIKGF